MTLRQQSNVGLVSLAVGVVRRGASACILATRDVEPADSAGLTREDREDEFGLLSRVGKA